MVLDIHEILKILPHRYPILLIDRILEVFLVGDRLAQRFGHRNTAFRRDVLQRRLYPAG